MTKLPRGVRWSVPLWASFIVATLGTVVGVMGLIPIARWPALWGGAFSGPYAAHSVIFLTLWVADALSAVLSQWLLREGPAG